MNSGAGGPGILSRSSSILHRPGEAPAPSGDPMFASFARFLAPAALAVAAVSYAGAVETVDEALEDYKPVSGVSGNLNSVGSDTLSNLVTFWAEGFSALYPNVNIQMETKGSSSAPPALIEGTAQLGPMSREM